MLKLKVWIARGANMDNIASVGLVFSKSDLCKPRVSQGAELQQDIHRGCDFSTGFGELSTGARVRSYR